MIRFFMRAQLCIQNDLSPSGGRDMCDKIKLARARKAGIILVYCNLHDCVFPLHDIFIVGRISSYPVSVTGDMSPFINLGFLYRWQHS